MSPPATSVSVESVEENDSPSQTHGMPGDAWTDSVTGGSGSVNGSGTEPLACVSCRARKLKCDRTKPACSRCVKVETACVYPESRRKPTVKRRNVKELEARLAQVEDYLKGATKTDVSEVEADVDVDADVEPGSDLSSFPDRSSHEQFADFDFATNTAPLDANVPSTTGFDADTSVPGLVPGPDPKESSDANLDNDTRLMGLGISEGLPPMEVMEDLNRMFFATQHFYIPVVHPGRYLQAFYGGPLRKPPMCLQYSIWAIAAHLDDKYGQYSEVFYLRARQYADADEMKGFGEHFVTLFHAQAYCILASFEAKCMLFTRAAITTARCVRLVNMMGLDRLDRPENDIAPTLAPPTSWVDLEERRRTFWGAYAIDAHASISAGWPSFIQCDDIATKLPSSEAAFVSGEPEGEPVFLEDVLQGASYSGFASTLVICRTFKAIMRHAHRTKPRDRPDDLMKGTFWTRHRTLDNELSRLFMFLPEKLRLPANVRDPRALQVNLNLHASVICLHHAAIEQAEAHGHGGVVKHPSLCRLRAAAEEVANILRMTSHNPGIFKSPLCALSMYCASTVYVYMAKEDSTSLTPIDIANLEVIIQAMEAIGHTHRATKAFLQQACLDVERNSLTSVIHLPNLKQYRNIFGGTGSYIPVLARVSVGRHTRVSPVLPGRLPLGNPEGRLRPMDLRLAERHLDSAPPDAEDLEGEDEGGGALCFRAMLGAVTRSVKPNGNHRRQAAEATKVGASTTTTTTTMTTTMAMETSKIVGETGVIAGDADGHQSHKRRRVAQSPGPDETLNFKRRGMNDSPNDSGFGSGLSTTGINFAPSSRSGRNNHGDYGNHANHHKRAPAQYATVPALLVDRTNSSASSSPMNQGGNGTGSETQTQTTGSSHMSPGMGMGMGFGLGNTMEENRVDLRPFLDRVATPIWDMEILDSIPASSDPWAIMNAELDWDGHVTNG